MKWDLKREEKGEIVDIDLHPITQKLLLQRGIDSALEADRFLHPDFERDLHDEFLFRDMRKVVDRIVRAKERNEIVGIFGDHDVDGISGTTVLSEALTDLGIKNIPYIPDKHTEGHGINQKAMDAFSDAGATLMISVDCGSTNVAEVEYAKKKGMETIIIDHHNTPEILPDAYAIINPKVPDETYPFDGLCGTGAAYKVIIALYREMQPENVSQLKWLLDIVSIGTIADCVPLIDENRTIAKYGLLVLSKTRRIGYQEMIDVGRLPISDEQMPDAQTIAFHIAPRINAAGRMAHAKDAFDLLIEKDRDKARERAEDIEQKNVERRKITEKYTKQATKIVEKNFVDKKYIVIADPAYPVGIIGIIAGRLASEYGRPAGIFNKGEKESRGSFRSIPNVNLVAALDGCAAHIVKYGGHHQAAGATILNENMTAFEACFEKEIEKQLADHTVEQKHIADLEIDPRTVDFTLVQELMKFSPFGQDNTEPIFLLRDLIVAEKRMVGKTGKHVKLGLRTDDTSPQLFEAIGFSMGDVCEEFDAGHSIDLLCNIQLNEWNGNQSIQFNMIDIRLARKNNKEQITRSK